MDQRSFGTDLDQPDGPDAIRHVLRNAADKMREQAAELDSAWQDKGAGNPWRVVADALEAAATRIERKL